MSLRLLISSSTLVATGTAVGCALGLMREILIATHFGIGHIADAAILLLLIPEFLASLLVGNAVGPTLVPAFAARNEARALALFWQVVIAVMLALVMIATILNWQGDHFLFLLTQTSGHLLYTSGALTIILLALPFMGASHVIISYLQYRGRFTVPAFSNAIYNAVIVIALWLASTHIMTLAVAILIAIVFRLLCYAAAFCRSGGCLNVSFLRPREITRQVAAAYAVTSLNGLFSLLPVYAPYMIVAASGAGLAIFNFAFKLVVLPGLIGTLLAQMTLLPWLVSLRKHMDSKAYRRTCGMTLQLVWLLSWCMCLVFSIASEPISTLFFSYGKMTGENVKDVAHLFAIGVWAVPGMWITATWQQIFYAHEKTRAPFAAALMQAAVIPLCLLGQTTMGTPGVVIGYAASQYLPILVLIRYGRKDGLVARWLPQKNYWVMSAASLAAFIPLMLLFTTFPLPAAASVLAAMAIGLMILITGASTDADVRQWFMALRKKTP